jgi:hypothetical protein
MYYSFQFLSLVQIRAMFVICKEENNKLLTYVLMDGLNENIWLCQKLVFDKRQYIDYCGRQQQVIHAEVNPRCFV